MTTTTTTAPAYIDPALAERNRREAEHAAQVHAARLKISEDRKAARQPLYFGPGATEEQLTTAGDVAAAVALRTLYHKSGLQMYADLRNAQRPDDIARHATAYAERQSRAQAAADLLGDITHEQLSAAAAYLKAGDPEAAAAAEAMADELSRQRATAQSDREAAKAALYGHTLSDRADLVQAAILSLLETQINPAPIDPERIAAAGLHPDELSPEQLADLQNAANFRAAVNAARRESTRLAHPDALNHVSTKRTPASADDVQQWIDTMGKTGADTRRPACRKNTRATDCYDTMERKSGNWYRIRHYKTTAPYTSIEQVELDRGQPLLDPNGGGIYTTAAKAADNLHSIIDRANLTPTERNAIRLYLSDPEVTAEAQQAKELHMLSRAAAIAKAAAQGQGAYRAVYADAVLRGDNAAGRRRWTVSLRKAGYKNEDSRKRGKRSIIKALKAAIHPAPLEMLRDCPTPRPDIIGAIAGAAAPRPEDAYRVRYCDPDTAKMSPEMVVSHSAKYAAMLIMRLHKIPVATTTPAEAAEAERFFVRDLTARHARPVTTGAEYIQECADPKNANTARVYRDI